MRVELDGRLYVGPRLTGAATAFVPRALATIPELHRTTAAVAWGRELPPDGDPQRQAVARLRSQIVYAIMADPTSEALARDVLRGWEARVDGEGLFSLANEWDDVFSGCILHPYLLMLEVLGEAGFFRMPGIAPPRDPGAAGPTSPEKAGGV